MEINSASEELRPRPGPGGAMPNRVMVVDDHDVLRRGLRALLQTEFGIEGITEAASLPDALSSIQVEMPDVVIVDLHLGQDVDDGIELCRQIRDRWPVVRPLIYSASEDPIEIARAIDAGAAGYVLKGADYRELVTAVAKAFEGERCLTPSTTKVIVDETRARGQVEEALRVLSPSERIVHERIIHGASYDDIANDLNVSVKTVRNLAASARRKLRGDGEGIAQEGVA
jgi:DNA-binding NarL/FixJ family response regulator